MKKLQMSTHEIGPPWQCEQFNCFIHFMQEEQQAIIRNYNALPSHDAQYQYLAGRMTLYPVISRRPRCPEAEISFW
ncbi:hypothetical protein PGB90_002743 [Kerria lacca]